MDDWHERASRLAAELAKAGVLTDPRWRQVLACVPRHVFVPSEPLGVVYSDRTLITQRLDYLGQSWPTSSSTAPSLMMRLLQELEVQDGASVLEVGTGTGYNAALLAERLGSHNVVSIDIDPSLVTDAAQRLKAAGYDPLIVHQDGREGYPERSPYDRVIATVAFEGIPYCWVEQVRPGGIIVADLRPPGAFWMGALVKLTVGNDGTATGPFLAGWDSFMSARPDRDTPGAPPVVNFDMRRVRQRPARVAGEALETGGLSLAIWQQLPGLFVSPGEQMSVIAADGSWCEVPRTFPEGSGQISFGGPGDVWATVETLQEQWLSQGAPGAEQYRLTITRDGESVRLS